MASQWKNLTKQGKGAVPDARDILFMIRAGESVP